MVWGRCSARRGGVGTGCRGADTLPGTPDAQSWVGPTALRDRLP